jgi:hypothetical protein
MSSQSRMAHIALSRVCTLTVGELVDAIVYRLNTDEQVIATALTAQQCQEGITALKQYLLEEHGQVPRA